VRACMHEGCDQHVASFSDVLAPVAAADRHRGCRARAGRARLLTRANASSGRTPLAATSEPSRAHPIRAVLPARTGTRSPSPATAAAPCA
jgi:hypothetical protein